jgi:hypothetical protein
VKKVHGAGSHGGALVAAIAAVRPVPPPVIEVVPEPDGGERETAVVDGDVEEVTPPPIACHIESFSI